LSFFKDNTATIYVIANTGAMLDIGQERSKEETALTAEPHCGPDFTYPRSPHATFSNGVSGSRNHPSGWPLLDKDLSWMSANGKLTPAGCWRNIAISLTTLLRV
jgi:hypothetical protein